MRVAPGMTVLYSKQYKNTHQKVYSYVCGHGFGTSLADCSGRIRLTLYGDMHATISGGSRNLERGVQPLVHETHPANFGVATPTSNHVHDA